MVHIHQSRSQSAAHVRSCGLGRLGYRWGMTTTDPENPYPDPVEDEEVSARDPDEMPLEADEADVAEQRVDVPGWDDEDADVG